MAAPGIELRWGYGLDVKPRKKEIVRPFVKEAISLALEGLDDLGLYLKNRKYLWIQQGDPDRKWDGGAKGKTCHISLSPSEIARKRIDTVWLAAAILHELVHLVHEEYVPGDGMLELAGAEGIAHVAQYDFANELLQRRGRRGPPYRRVEAVRSMPKRELHKLEGEFWKATARPDSSGEASIERWFGRYARPIDLPKGVVIGISAVSQQLERGYDIAELITLEPYDLLDVA